MSDFDGLYKTQDGSALRFFEEPAQNNAASERHGRPIFDQCLMVEVITPGSRESAPVFELERTFAAEVGIDTPRRGIKYREYAVQIEAYRAGNNSTDMRGTPLAAWPAISTAIAATLKHAGVYTVDALAALPDSRLSVLGPGGLALRARAIAFIAAASGNAGNEAMAAELATLKTDNERLTGEVADLSARLTAALQAAPAPAPVPTQPDPLSSAPAAPEAASAKPPKPPKAAGGNALPII
jgi:hypothetical protein